MKNYKNIYPGTPTFGSINIFFDAGGKIETVGTRGISHLVEHLLCKSFEDHSEAIDAHGISNNATTSENKVMFYFNGINEHLKKFEEKILKIFSYVPTKEQFEVERKVVLAEYENYMTDRASLAINILRKYFNTFNAIGWREDIEKITYEEYLDFQKKHFSKPSEIIRVGDTDFDSFYDSLEYSEKFEKTYVENDYGDTYVHTNRVTKKPLIAHWFLTDFDEIELEVVCNYLSDGLKSPLYEKLRNELGLVYYVSLASLKMGNKQLAYLSYEIDPKDRSITKKSVRDVIKNSLKNVSEERYNNIVLGMKTEIMKSNIFNFTSGYAENAYSKNDYVSFFKTYNYESFKKSLERFSKEFLENSKISEQAKKIKI